MAMTADSTSNHHSPRGSGFSGDGLSSPQLRRKNFPSAWAQVVRGEPDSVLVAAPHSPSSSPSPPTSLSDPADNNFSSSKVASASSSPPPDNSQPDDSMDAESSDANNGNAAPPKKPAWKKPSPNGVPESGNNVMGTLWPALSESTKASPKSSLADSSSSKTDGSVSNSQVPVIAQLPQKLSTANANPNSNPNRTTLARQRKRGGNNASNSGSGPAQTSFNRSSQPPPFPVLMPPNSYANLGPAMADPSPREPMYRGNNWDSRPGGGYVSQPHSVSDHRNSSRRGNYGPRGDGNYHNHFGGRRDHDRGNYGNARDVQVQQQRGPPRGFVRPPPPNAASFLPPQTMRPFANHPMGFPEFIYIPQVPMEPFRGVPGMPFMTPAPHAAVLMPVPEPPITALLVHQIDYYFSDANLVKDEFLKSNMDDQGWVPITLISSFPRVKNLTNNIKLILDSLRTSTVVEVQDDKVRRRNEWMKWIPTSSRVPTEPDLSSLVGSSNDLLATSFQKMTVEGDTANPHTQDAPGRHSAESTVQSEFPNGEGTEDSFSNEN